MKETTKKKAFFKEGIQNDKAFLKDNAFLKDGMDDAALAGVAGGLPAPAKRRPGLGRTSTPGSRLEEVDTGIC